jgi:hypothetical protein
LGRDTPAPLYTINGLGPTITARALGVALFAACATLVDLFPSRADDFALQMKELGYKHYRGRQVVSWLATTRATARSTARAGSPTRSCGW